MEEPPLTGLDQSDSATLMESDQKWRFGRELSSTVFIPSFHCLAFTLLSLHLPLSFLLMTKLTTAHHLISTSRAAPYHPISIVIALLVETNPPLLHSVLLFICLFALMETVTGRKVKPRLHVGWATLCLSQLCVGLGVEVTTNVAGGLAMEENSVQTQLSWAPQMLFFVGLYETALFWSRVVVKPAVDDAAAMTAAGERWVDRAAMGAAFGGLWWWKVRGEVVKVSRDGLMGMEVVDLLCWSVYWAILVIGFVRLVKVPFWIVTALMIRPQPKLVEGAERDQLGGVV